MSDRETPAFVAWEHWHDGVPEIVAARWTPGEAWAFINGTWESVDPVDVGQNGRMIDETTFNSTFANLTALPATAFHSGEA
jgi:hypothetical protein